MANLADDPNAVIMFQDEVHFQVQTTVREQWVKIGTKLRVKSKPGHESVAYSGFVVYKTGQFFIFKPSRFTYETTIIMLREMLKYKKLKPEQHIYLVMDNAPWHKKARRLIEENSDGQYDDIKEKIIFVDIPPYSPDLNPIEQVWRITRREVTHNRYHASLFELTKRLDEYFANFKEPNEKLATLCTFNFNKSSRPLPRGKPRKHYRVA